MPAGESSTDVTGLFVTRMLPFASTIGPRGASTRTVRTWLACARAAYCEPESTCSAQSRMSSAANPITTSAPRIAAGGRPAAPDPVARERQHERREPHRAHGGGVDREPGEEAAHGTGHAAPQQGERDERDQQDVGNGAEDVSLREDRDLGDRRGE